MNELSKERQAIEDKVNELVKNGVTIKELDGMVEVINDFHKKAINQGELPALAGDWNVMMVQRLKKAALKPEPDK